MITEVGPKRPQLVPCYEEVIAPIDPSHTHHRAGHRDDAFPHGQGAAHPGGR